MIHERDITKAKLLLGLCVKYLRTWASKLNRESLYNFVRLPRHDRAAQVAMLGVIATILLAVLNFVSTAKHALEKLNFDDNQSFSGSIYFAAPRRLLVGAKLNPDELDRYLRQLNFTNCAPVLPNPPGSYCTDRQVSGEVAIRIYSRLYEMPNVRVAVRKGRITKLNESHNGEFDAASDTDQVSIEPETVSTVIPSLALNENCPGLKQINSSVICRTHSVRRVMQYEQFSDSPLLDALLVSEDPHFYEHHGIYWKRLLGAPVKGNGGASTIQMQLIRNAVLFDSTRSGIQGQIRKIQEIFGASLMDKMYPKDRILTAYLNSVFLGSGHSGNLLGFCSAAQDFFGSCHAGRNIRELTLSQAALLVANNSRPTRLSLLAHLSDYPVLSARANRNALIEDFRRAISSRELNLPADKYIKTYEVLLKLRDSILKKLHEQYPEKYSALAIAQAMETPIQFAAPRKSDFEQLVQPLVASASRGSDLERALGQLDVTAYGNSHIYLSVEPDVVRASGRALSKVVPRLSKSFKPVIAGIKEKEISRPNRLLGALLILDPRTGEVLSLVGGTGIGNDGAGVAINRLSSPFSTVKPLWTAMAIERALFMGRPVTAATIPPLSAMRTDLPGLPYRPEYSALDEGTERLRPSLARSRNDVAIWTYRTIGGANAARPLFEKATGAKIGDASDQLAIGTLPGMGVSMMQMARAFSSFAAGGEVPANLRFIRSLFVDGEQKFGADDTPEKIRLFSAPAAYVTTQMLRSVVGYGEDGVHGTAAPAARAAGIDVQHTNIAAKTGSGDTTWMISIHPRLIIVATVGFEMGSAEGKFTAAKTAAVLWAQLVQELRDVRPDLLEGDFPVPPGVVAKQIDPYRGCLVNEGGMREYFIDTRVPLRCHS